VTLQEVEKRVAEIGRIGVDDDASAHGKEDDLWRDVLRTIANGAPDAADLAREALRTRDFAFARWTG